MTRGEGEWVELLRSLLAQPSGPVHLAGACGVGMAGVACHLKARGFEVSGCDLSAGPLSDWLRAKGIPVLSGHDASHIGADTRWVIRSAAVPLSSPEIAAARDRGLPVFSRGEVLPALLRGRTSVAVGGTHGKTTTTGFIAQLLRSAGRDPGWCIGGEVAPFDGVAGTGAGSTLVVEADESDGTLALYEPDVAVVTNIEFDHMEHFADVAEFEECFRRFVRQATRRVVYGCDDPRAATLCSAVPGSVSFGFLDGACVRAAQIEETGQAQRYTLVREGLALGAIDLPVPGRHNVLNSLAAAAVGFELGLSFEEIRLGLAGVNLPRRRFERIAEADGITVLSDYAHHPSEIAAFLKAAATVPARRRIVVYQPHRYTRTLALGPDFPPAFQGVDELVLTPVYAASEAPLKGGTIWDLYARFRGAPSAPVNCIVSGSNAAAWAYLRRRLAPGDLFMVVGAGDVEEIAHWAGEWLRAGRPEEPWSLAALRESPEGRTLSPQTELRAGEPLAPKTTLGVGGTADLWASVGSVEDLQALVKWARRVGAPLHLLGAASNTLVSDLGARGLALRLAGPLYRSVREQDGLVVAGAAAPLSALLDFLESRGLEGLEFLEGVPGTVGGALRMNAGAWGGEIGPRVEWIRCLNADGSARTLCRSELRYAYRRFESLDGLLVLDAAFSLVRGDASRIAARRGELREKRRWMDGLRSAGSVFKNPDGAHVGRLLEDAGMKGVRVGGAVVTQRHANVIVTEPGARASDVRALMETMRWEVESRCGYRLEAEVRWIE
jgi:UDP-N-acetylmuramate--alanine ligase